jgi:hypothetical protein
MHGHRLVGIDDNTGFPTLVASREQRDEQQARHRGVKRWHYVFLHCVSFHTFLLFMDLDLRMEMGEIVHETAPLFRNLIFV